MAWRGWQPSTSTAPVVGCESPSTMSMVVVLPAPLGPRKATISPCSIVQVDAADGLDGAEDLGEAGEADRGHRRARCATRGRLLEA